MFTARDRKKCEELFEKYYQGRSFSDARYRGLIREHILPGQRLLDAGCGTHMRFCRELSADQQVFGIDLEPFLKTDNQSAPFGVCSDLIDLPFASASFDIVISRSVVEHIESPRRVFREFLRVLRPGGKVVIVTPNKYDYVSVIASLTPYWLHRRLVSKLFPVSPSDVFPTLYRANTPRSIRKAFTSVGFVERELDTVNHYPAYLMFSPVLFRLGIAYERFTSLRTLRSLRGSILCVFEKPGDAPPLGSAALAAAPVATALEVS